MSFISEYAARCFQSWLESFRSRHGLSAQSVDSINGSPWAHIGDERLLLHVGCGNATKASTCSGFQSVGWREIRLDIDLEAEPDVVCSIVDMVQVPDASVDAVFSSHNIEHLYPHEVILALSEFNRVLNLDGFLVLTCPDLQSVCRLVTEDKLTEQAYLSPAGPIAPLDILYGHRPRLATGNLFMAHHTGFTMTTLLATLREAGFANVLGYRRESCFDLWVLACKSHCNNEDMSALAAEFLPSVG